MRKLSKACHPSERQPKIFEKIIRNLFFYLIFIINLFRSIEWESDWLHVRVVDVSREPPVVARLVALSSVDKAHRINSKEDEF